MRGEMMKEEMTCERVMDLLLERAGEILDAESDAVVREHLEACAACAHWAQALKAAIRMFGTAARVEVPPSLRRRVRERVMADAEERESHRADRASPIPEEES
ncbi:MAG: hypothetical protein D6723_05415 [Acidobacteria bacterium]|nr:MAG: hypothetical protein D6723_05415 [Acidobacteriota bacterium]